MINTLFDRAIVLRTTHVGSSVNYSKCIQKQRQLTDRLMSFCICLIYTFRSNGICQSDAKVQWALNERSCFWRSIVYLYLIIIAHFCNFHLISKYTEFTHCGRLWILKGGKLQKWAKVTRYWPIKLRIL